MKVFLSYRRSDNDYLAAGVHDGLLGCSSSVAVFWDVESIGAGADFREVIVEEVRAADVVVVLIGPLWQANRLGDPDDFVRLELVTAREAGRRTVPVLHGGAREPVVTELPPELGWLPSVNMVEFGGPRQLGDDIRRLFERITNRVPAMHELRDRASGLFDQNRDDDLLDVVEEAWREHAASPSPALAECCRLGSVALRRSGASSSLADLWTARSLSVAYQTGATNAFAASLLLFFFRLVEKGEPAAAREVIAEIGRLMKVDDPTELPPAGLMRRLFQEKLAFSYFAEGEYERALAEYEVAARYARAASDVRGELKIDGGMALCLEALGRSTEAVAMTMKIEGSAEHAGFPDVARTARHNLDVLRTGRGTTAPYEVT